MLIKYLNNHSLNALQNEVQDYLNEGWQLYKGLIIPSDSVGYIQTIIKNEPKQILNEELKNEQ